MDTATNLLATLDSLVGTPLDALTDVQVDEVLRRILDQQPGPVKPVPVAAFSSAI